MLESKYGVLTACSQTGLIFNRNKPDSTADGALLLLKGICISVIWTKKHYFLFDSHSKNEKGESCPDGYSILIKFNNKNQLESHILRNYINQQDTEPIQFELQYVNVSQENNENFLACHQLFQKRQRNSTELVDYSIVRNS